MTKHMSYYEHLLHDIDAISPGISENLDHLEQVPDDIALKVVRRLVRSACIATHIGNINSGRELSLVVPRAYFPNNHAEIVKEIDLNDGWDYRRWIELLDIVAPELVDTYLQIGKASVNENVRTATTDFEGYDRKKSKWYLFRLTDHRIYKDGIGLLPGIPQTLLDNSEIGAMRPGAKLTIAFRSGLRFRTHLKSFAFRVPNESDNPRLLQELPMILIVPEHDIAEDSPLGSLVYWETE